MYVQKVSELHRTAWLRSIYPSRALLVNRRPQLSSGGKVVVWASSPNRTIHASMLHSRPKNHNSRSGAVICLCSNPNPRAMSAEKVHSTPQPSLILLTGRCNRGAVRLPSPELSPPRNRSMVLPMLRRSLMLLGLPLLVLLLGIVGYGRWVGAHATNPPVQTGALHTRISNHW